MSDLLREREELKAALEEERDPARGDKTEHKACPSCPL